jgi:hypothetical protein
MKSRNPVALVGFDGIDDTCDSLMEIGIGVHDIVSISSPTDVRMKSERKLLIDSRKWTTDEWKLGCTSLILHANTLSQQCYVMVDSMDDIPPILQPCFEIVATVNLLKDRVIWLDMEENSFEITTRLIG